MPTFEGLPDDISKKVVCHFCSNYKKRRLFGWFSFCQLRLRKKYYRNEQGHRKMKVTCNSKKFPERYPEG